MLWILDYDYARNALKSTSAPRSSVGKHRARVSIARRIRDAVQDLFKKP